MKPLRIVMLMDAAVLVAVGVLFVWTPAMALSMFGFKEVSEGIRYIVATLGALYGSIGVCYVVASTDPERHVLWVEFGIVRGLLEAALGVLYAVRGAVTWQQAGFAVVSGLAVTIAYAVLLPRSQEPAVESPA